MLARSMQFFQWNTVSQVLAMFAIAVVGLGQAHSQTMPSAFRVDTDIYTDLKQPPIQRTVTLFTEGVYFDFGSEELGITTIIDVRQQQIVLLDAKKKLKTQVSLVSLQTEIEQAASQAPESMKQITIQEWSEDSKNGRQLTLGNDDLRYVATVLAPKNQQAAIQYADFADWSARLNAVYPPKIPPYIRLWLNRALADEKVLPKRISRIGRQTTVYANVTPTWELSADDQKRIEAAYASQQSYAAVTPAVFWAK